MDTDNVRLPLLWRLHWHTHLKVDFIILSQMCKDWGKIWAWWRGRGREDGRERDDGMTSPRQWPWVWAHRGRWWRTGKPGVSVGWRRGRQDWALGNKLCEGCAVILQGFHGNRMSVRSSCLISERNGLESSDPRPLRGPAFAQSTPAIHWSLNSSLLWPAFAAEARRPWPSLCSPAGAPVPGILQARTLEGAAMAFSNAWKSKAKGKSLSPVWLLAAPRPAAHQAPPSMGFSRQEDWSGCHFLLQLYTKP